jgi:ABC-type Fe3+/spermidine/putrescine transport system ATPase subunit
MGYIEINNLVKEFGELRAVDEVSFSAKRGEFVTLLGPSGCGKTTTLRSIAGLETPTSGSIKIAGEDVTDEPAYNRDIGMVFQDYALFPHKTVGENVGFPLKMQGVPKSEREERISEILDLVKLPNTKNRSTEELSGGQQQRVALARALIYEPDVLLMDEPLSSLDRKLRQQLRIEIERIQDETGITTIYVTHDQLEAFSLSDKIFVLKDGNIEQKGTPPNIYENPTSSFVGDFIGDSSKLTGEIVNKNGTIFLNISPDIELKLQKEEGIDEGNEIDILLRSEKMSLSKVNNKNSNSIKCNIKSVNYLGEKTVAYCEISDGSEIVVSEEGYSLAKKFDKHDKAYINISPGEVIILRDGRTETKSGKVIS